MKNNGRLYLCLAIACLIGFVAIFVATGFLGIYDTVYVTGGVVGMKIGPCKPSGGGSVSSYEVVECRGVLHFRYELVNRRFSSYSAPVQASVWIGDGKVMDLLSQDITVKPLGEAVVEWDFDTRELEPHEQGCNVGECMVKVEQGGLERVITVDSTCAPSLWSIEVRVDDQTELEEAVNIIKCLPFVTEVSHVAYREGKTDYVIHILLQSRTHALTEEELTVVDEQMDDALSELGAGISQETIYLEK